MFVIILMLPWAAIHAAGLGKLTLNSALGQPLSAEIDIVTANRDEISSLKASIATREAFSQAGINYEPNFSTIRVSIESRTDGSPFVKLASPQAVNDPFLNILVELNWASGRILREYAVLLDPVEANVQDIAAPKVSPNPVANAAQKNVEKAPDSKRNRPEKSSSKQANRSANQTSDTYGPVIRGDTLSSIARQVLPAGVDLNQMLVALYRANRDAFIANNMNLLRVGAVLKIPEKNEAAAIDASTARTEIRMQVADWHNYQSKIAAIHSESPSANIQQSDQGKITTSIDKKSSSTRESAKEVLRLSSGAQPADKDGQMPESALVDRLRMMEEDAIARNLALKEANERVAMLEKSIDNLKQLLELKDSVLAQAQIKAGAGAKAEAKPEVRPAETVSAIPGSEAKPDISASQVPEQEAPPANETTIKTNVEPQSPQETEGDSLTDQMVGNIEYIGAATILILLAVLLYLKKRRNQSEEENELDEKNTDFSSAMKSRMASMAAAQAMPATEIDHTFSEHEKDDLTYENMNSHPESEGYGDRFDKDSTDYEEHTEQIKESESETRFASELSDGNEVSADGAQSNHPAINLNLQEDFSEDRDQSTDFIDNYSSEDSENKIEFDLTDEANEIEQGVVKEQPLSAVHDAEDKIESSDGPESLQQEINASDYELEIDLDDSKHALDPIDFEDKVSEKDNSIAFESTHSDIDLAEKESANEIEIPKINAESRSVDNDSNTSELMDEALDFDQHQESTDNTKRSEPVPHVPELGLADIDLDIEDSDSVDKKNQVSDSNEKSEQWQEIETKLDLAKAYQEMDDKEGAKEMLEEVIRDGDTKQKKVARKLLKSL
ncbi:FimV/HubP family polar landmark protein [Nitrosomonas sp. Nm84]|uniref:FimV/HubP family polar landmark protein n=1 Tax=Nitrosomonas sp. Nm84 TaxID=200124 RepID=UPI0021ABE297|nr:FimV/HubP family polar landmark protein [Nitrosomonas sp. Nm84]